MKKHFDYSKFDYKDSSIAELTDDEVESIPASFAIEYLNCGKLADQLSALGCSFRQGGHADENNVYVMGVMPDGTEIRIEAKKGEHYKSPQEYVQEVRARIKAAKDKQ